jgi:hypothetical protein
MVVVTAEGCIVHKRVMWNRCDDAISIFKCEDCGLDVAREAEDTGCGG